MRTVIVSIVAVALLAGSAVGVAAQSEEPAPVTFVTGTVVEQYDHIEVRDAALAAEPALGEPRSVRGFEIIPGEGVPFLVEQVVEWSDPRLPAEHWLNLDYYLVTKLPESPEGAMAVVTSHLLEGSEGRWRGHGRAVEDDDDRYSLYELVGEGAYEGLFALLRGTPGKDTHGPWDHAYEGYIFEGELTAIPDGPVPVATEGMQSFPFPTEPPAE